MPAKNKTTTVYPLPSTSTLLGGNRTKLFNRALECFAFQLRGAMEDNSKQIHGIEWRLLRQAIADRKFDPHSPFIGRELARAVRSLFAQNGDTTAGLFTRSTQRHAEVLAAKLEPLDHLHAWAAVWRAEAAAQQET